ncbi:MAG: flagellar assembly protein [Geobacteraceae bacterium]|nr:MAG: flagellar assembly protein [Geobacteraceae bacterium]
MSSSKVIKSGQLAEHSVSSVSYLVLSGAAAADVASSNADGFQPLVFNGSAGVDQISVTPPGGEEEVPVEMAPLAEGMQLISEDELQRKLDETFQKGVDEGRQAAERGLSNVFKSLREGITGITRLREKVLRESEDDLLKLAIMVARKIIQQEISQDPQILANIVAAAISGCTDLDRVNIRLNPEDYHLVAADRQLYFSGIGRNTNITMTPDDAILPGGCMVETVTGTIDARIEVQLDEIYRRFVEERGMPGETPLKLLAEECRHDDSKS